ncbi:dienelactone hydrolase family protein [Caulobacter sp. NIBR2454]|uniref:dienelactone hydrolase family protein n=1 Tax=Caulobacter sp. NIBR2454 TaxID=3015996 RepID=UPI0022B6A5C1|nr:dienelactone hydrolase family protein [Caulobacter sp. NIBR2454]
MAETITLKSPRDGFEFTALHALPKGEAIGGVVVLQEIFGLDEYIHADVARWADAGYEVIAPALFDRYEPGFVADHGPEGFARGRNHALAHPLGTALSDIQACIDEMHPRGPVFVVGYCYGGSLAWLAAGRCKGLSAAASYYGSLVGENADIDLRCPVIVHLGRKDAHIPADGVAAAIHAHHPDVPVHIYEASGHGFNNDGRPDSDPHDAAEARRLTRELFVANAD